MGIKKFVGFYGKSAEEILQMRMEDLTPKLKENVVERAHRAKRFERELERFHAWLLQKGYSINSARSLSLGIAQLFRYYSMPLVKRTGSPTAKTVESTRSFPLRIEHVRKMFSVADLRERVMLSIATDLALRIGDFINIKREDLPDLEQEPPVAFTVMTRKEGVPAYGFLSSETVELLKVYLPTLGKEKNLYLFPSNGSHISDDRVGIWLKELAKRAGIKTDSKHLSFHCFRKMYLSAATDVGLFTAGKRLAGKTISKSDTAYLTVVKLREAFLKIKEQLTIQAGLKPENHKRIDQMQQTIANQQTEVRDLNTRIEAITHEYIGIKPIKQQLENLHTEIVTLRRQNNELRDAIETIVKIVVEKFPFDKIFQKDGKLYEKKVVGIDVKTGRFIKEATEVTDEGVLKTYEEICDLIDNFDTGLKKALREKKINLKLNETD
jgi:integrase